MAFPLLTLARHRPVQTRSIDLGHHVATVLRMLRPLVGDRLTLVFEEPTDPLVVLGDETLLEQVLVHLVNRALHMPAAGREFRARLVATMEKDGESLGGRRCAALQVTMPEECAADEANEDEVAQQRLELECGMDIIRRVIKGMDGTVRVTAVEPSSVSITLCMPLVPTRGPSYPYLVGLVDRDVHRRARMRHTLVDLGYAVFECESITELRMRIFATRRPQLLLVGCSEDAEATHDAASVLGTPLGYYAYAEPSTNFAMSSEHPFLKLPHLSPPVSVGCRPFRRSTPVWS
jgi:hypothetical protein